MSGRPVITGMGVISSAGPGLQDLAAALRNGQSTLRPIPNIQATQLRCREAGLITDAASTAAIEAAGLAEFDRFVPLALLAARQALAQARLDPAPLGPRCGLIFSTCSGPMLLIERHYDRIIAGHPELSPEELHAKRYYTAARVLAQALRIRGVTNTVVTACSASTAAIALAADLIRCGVLDAALAGGSDAFSLSTLAGFDGLKATCESRCAPFSRPIGLNLGEAGAFVVLESAPHAAARGAAVQAIVLGSGMSNDAFHPSAPEPAGRGLAAAMNRALADAGLGPDAIAYINAHGTGTEANDKAETRAIRKVFGDLAPCVPVSSTKSTVGHCLGAAGALEAIASITCAQAAILPATANFTEPREGCSLDYVPTPGRPWTKPRVFLNNNAAFGGHNASLVLALPESSPQPPDAARSEPVWITGIGVVCNNGTGLLRGDQAPHLETVALSDGRTIQVGRVPDDSLTNALGRRLDLREMDRSSRFATVAAHLALRQANWPERPAARADLGLFLSLSAGPSWAESTFLTSFLSNHRQVRELAPFPYIVPSSVAGNVCRSLFLAGHNVTLCSGPGAGLLGLGHAVVALRAGHTNAILCGAVDELSDRILEDMAQAGQLTPGRPGPGEGSVVFLLENRDAAQARGAKPLAEISGFAWATDPATAADPTAQPEPLRAVAAEALRQADTNFEALADVFQSKRRMPAAPPLQGRTHAGLRHLTGLLDASQELLDVAYRIQQPVTGEPSPGGPILAVVDAPTGLLGAVVFRRVSA